MGIVAIRFAARPSKRPRLHLSDPRSL